MTRLSQFCYSPVARRLFALAVAMALISSAGCALRKKPTGEDFYQQAQWDFAQHEYKASIEGYQKVIDQYPFSPYAEESEMKIGLAYYQEKEYAQAVAALDDFQRMHPTSKSLDLVNYYMALSYYNQIGREDQDQSKTEAALKRFEVVEQRFPEGSFAELAKEHIDVCREMLARNQLVIGNYYFKRANFRAAESRFAELMQKYPDTPVAPDALYTLAMSLEKQGKKYSAAQAFAALKQHFPNTAYATNASAELKKLHQPIDTEEDPLPTVLAETGYPMNAEVAPNNVRVRQRSEDTAFAADGIPSFAAAPSGPVLKPPPPSGSSSNAPTALASNLSTPKTAARVSDGATPPAGDTSLASLAHATSTAISGTSASSPTEPPRSGFSLNAPTAGSPSSGFALPSPPEPEPAAAPDSSNDQSSKAAASAPLHPVGPVANTEAPGSYSMSPGAFARPPGAATLTNLRLSSNDPPLTMIVELSGPVGFDKSMDSDTNSATVTISLHDVTLDHAVPERFDFNRSIFKDCAVSRNNETGNTTLTLHTKAVSTYSVIPLDDPPRLLVTFTPAGEGKPADAAAVSN